ncbi:unnamed protein product [Ambrosiozyma monospora]|uniref:Unnamed protein product n=1 Tax=Ambrosiozyma monospora TaxID=43982 RepID=A0ACB5SXS3_AMBMO|nr:unnamed protein product [Ambrosiozyma monospora]
MSQYKELGTYHKGFHQFLNVSSEKLTPITSSRVTKAREKLGKLTLVQFFDLSTDVYDELQRRINESHEQPKHLLPKSNYHPKRNQAREKLAALPSSRFKDLVNDVYVEIEKRDPSIVNGGPSKLTLDTNAINKEGRKKPKTPTDDKKLDLPAADSPSQREIKTGNVVPKKAELTWSSDEDEEDDINLDEKLKLSKLTDIETPQNNFDDYSPIQLDMGTASHSDVVNPPLKSPTSVRSGGSKVSSSHMKTPSLASHLSGARDLGSDDGDSNLKKQLNMIKQEKNDLQHKHDLLFSENESLKSDLKDHESLAKELKKLRAENTRLLEQKSSQSDGLKSLQDDSDKLIEMEQKYDALQDKYLDDTQKMMKGNEELSSEIETLMKDFTAIKEANEKKSSELSKLQAKYDKLLEEHSTFQGADRELSMVKDEYDNLKEDNARLKATHNSLLNEHAKLKKTFNQLKRDHDDLKEEFSKLESDFAETENSCNVLKEEKSILKTSNTKLKDQNAKLKDLQDNLKDQNEILKSSFEALKEEHRALKDSHISLKKQSLDRSLDRSSPLFMDSTDSLHGNAAGLAKSLGLPSTSAATVASLKSMSIQDSTLNEKEISYWQNKFQKERANQVFQHLSQTIPDAPNFSAFASSTGLISLTTVSEFYSSVETFLTYLVESESIQTKTLFERIASVVSSAKAIGFQAYNGMEEENINIRKLQNTTASALSNTRYYALTNGVVPRLLLDVSISDIYETVCDIVKDVKINAKENKRAPGARRLTNDSAYDKRSSTGSRSSLSSIPVPKATHGDDSMSVRPLRITQRLTTMEENGGPISRSDKPPSLASQRRPLSPVVVSIPIDHSSSGAFPDQSTPNKPGIFGGRPLLRPIVYQTPQI